MFSPQTKKKIDFIEPPAVTKPKIIKRQWREWKEEVSREDRISKDLKDIGEIAEKNSIFFAKSLNEGRASKSWNNASIVLMHISWQLKDVKNYRPISLLSVVSKLFSKVLTNSISYTSDSNQLGKRAGFQNGFSILDHIQTGNQVIMKTN